MQEANKELTMSDVKYEVPVYFRHDSDERSLRELSSKLLTETPWSIEPMVEVMAGHLETSVPQPLPCDDGIPDDDGVSRIRPASAAVFEEFFLEIGTSDFGTLHQQLFRDSIWGGLAVEPVAYLLDRLPTRGGLYKENAAMGCTVATDSREANPKTVRMKTVNAEHMVGSPERHLLGESRIVSAHEEATEEGIYDYIDVSCITMEELAAKHGLTPYYRTFLKQKNISSDELGGENINQKISLIKIDAEGSDLEILNGILDWYDKAELSLIAAAKRKNEFFSSVKEGVAWPVRIRFEVAHFDSPATETGTGRDVLGRVMSRLMNNGYACQKGADGLNGADDEDERFKASGVDTWWGALGDMDCVRHPGL